MSAHKRALLSPDSAALRRLDELSAQLRATARPDPAAAQAARQEALDRLSQAAAHTQARQELLSTRLDETLSGMDDRLQELERATGAALSAQAQELQAAASYSLSQAQGMLAGQVEALLAGQAEQYRLLLQQSRAERMAAARRLEERLTHQQRQGQRARQAALVALRQAQALLEGMQQSYPQADRLDGLEALLGQAQQDLAGGLGEAALALAQQVSFQLGELRLGCERELAERSLLHTAALEQARRVQALVEANRVVSAIDLEGRSLDFPLEVDYWTAGGWSAQSQKLQQALEYLAQPAEGLAQDELRYLLREHLPAIAQALPELVAEARRSALASQLRYNMAEAVLRALGEQGFALEQAAYLEGDLRQAYQLALHNLEGSQLVVTLAPQAAAGGLEHQLDLVSQDQPRRTPHELRQRARELARSLRRYGLQVLPPAPAVREEHPAYQVPVAPARPLQRMYRNGTTETLRAQS